MALIRTELAQTVENQCGDFSRQFRFDLQNEPTPGIIVQRVSRWFGVHQLYQVLQKKVPWFGKPAPGPVRNADWWFRPYMSGALIQNYVRRSGSDAYATETVYWEGWYIGAGRTFPSYAGLGMGGGGGRQAFDDEFSLCGIAPSVINLKDTTRGKFILRAQARYHPLIGAPAQLPAAACANFGLRVGNAQCAAGLPSSVVPPTGLTAATASSEHTIVVRWDSSVPDSRLQNGHTIRDYGESIVKSYRGALSYRDSYW